jgi:NAD(P)-dependent dehydrogenase (short-subunit alcohol dehydrogenase family)
VDFMDTLLSEAAPIRRTGRPLDIAETALWLASDASGYVNGQAIVVDGGLLTGPLRRNRPMGDAAAREAFRDTLLQAAGEQESE